MTTVIDTSVLIDHLRGHAPARQALTSAVAGNERLVGTVLTRTEILAGLQPGEESATHALLGIIDWAPVDERLADAAAALAQRYVATHPGIDTVDYVIAATTAQVGGRLWTRNVKHFPMIAGLRAPY